MSGSVTPDHGRRGDRDQAGQGVVEFTIRRLLGRERGGAESPGKDAKTKVEAPGPKFKLRSSRSAAGDYRVLYVAETLPGRSQTVAYPLLRRIVANGVSIRPQTNP